MAGLTSFGLMAQGKDIFLAHDRIDRASEAQSYPTTTVRCEPVKESTTPPKDCDRLPGVRIFA